MDDKNNKTEEQTVSNMRDSVEDKKNETERTKEDVVAASDSQTVKQAEDSTTKSEDIKNDNT